MDVDTKFSIFCGFVIGFLCLSFVQSLSDAQISEMTNSNEGILRTALKVHRVNKTTYATSGWFNITEDFSNKYKVEMRVHYSRLGNNQYTMLPFHFSRTPLCTFVDGLYRRRFSKLMEQYSDCPKQVEGEPLCPLYIKGDYTITKFPLNQSSVNRIFKAGLYKFQFVLTKSNSDDVVSRIAIHAKIS